MSVGWLYRWFPDKAAIVDGLTRRYLAEFEATIDELAQGFHRRIERPGGCSWTCSPTRRVPSRLSRPVGRLAVQQGAPGGRPRTKRSSPTACAGSWSPAARSPTARSAATACRAASSPPTPCCTRRSGWTPKAYPELSPRARSAPRHLRTAARRFPPSQIAPVSDTPLSRRRFLRTGVAAGAAAAAAGLPGADDAEAAKKKRKKRKRGRGTRTVDVAIVGAGFAGLTAARELVRDGRSVCGSRAATASAAGSNREFGGKEESERGGTFVGPPRTT